MPHPMTDKPRMTAVFEYDLKQHPGNPFHTDTPFGRPLVLQLGDFSVEVAVELAAETSQDAIDAARYRWLRSRDVDAIQKGGVFAGMTPENYVLNGDDLDAEVDFAMGLSMARAAFLTQAHGADAQSAADPALLAEAVEVLRNVAAINSVSGREHVLAARDAARAFIAKWENRHDH